MFITGIDIATTLNVFLHIDEVELDDTGDVTIYLVVRCTFFRGDFQEHTRCEGYLIQRGTIVAVALCQVLNFIVVITQVIRIILGLTI